jgi:hypothetical protein
MDKVGIKNQAPPDHISMAEFAKLAGVSVVGIHKAIGRGRIKSAVQLSGKRWWIHQERGLAEFKAGRDGRGGHRTPGGGAGRQSSQDAPGQATADQGATTHAQPAKDDASGIPGGFRVAETLVNAKTRHETIKATLAELELAEKEGRLVDAGKVKAEAFRKGRLVRDSILNIPDRISGELAAITDAHQIHVILSRELRQALEELAQ